MKRIYTQKRKFSLQQAIKKQDQSQKNKSPKNENGRRLSSNHSPSILNNSVQKRVKSMSTQKSTRKRRSCRSCSCFLVIGLLPRRGKVKIRKNLKILTKNLMKTQATTLIQKNIVISIDSVIGRRLFELIRFILFFVCLYY